MYDWIALLWAAFGDVSGMEWLANVNYRRAPPLISDCKNLFWTRVKCANNELKKARILDGALAVIGHFGVKKTSMDELAKAAGLSKQGLYHFESKEELLAAAADRYFTEGLRLVKEALSRPEVALQERLVEAMYAWCGRHLAHFHPSTLEVMEPRDNPISSKVQEVKLEFCRLLAEAVAKRPNTVTIPIPVRQRNWPAFYSSLG